MSTQQSTEERPIRHATSEYASIPRQTHDAPVQCIDCGGAFFTMLCCFFRNHFRSLFVDEFAEDLEHIRNAAPNGAAQNIESIVQFIKVSLLDLWRLCNIIRNMYYEI